ncbi:TRAP transporter substrate-binding protein [Pseudomonadota bacterium AL_CKDN230030165-1A_HGKHYDSX7]
MTRLNMLKPPRLLCGLASALILGVGVANARTPEAPAPITWRMATSWPVALPLLHETAVDFADTVAAASGNRLRIDVVDPARHGKPASLLQAVQAGEFDLAHTTAQYYAAQVPAIDFFTAVPFGLTPVEQEGWLREGGGQALFESIMAPRGIVPLTAGHTGIQMGGWFARDIRSPQDLTGLRIRVAGFPGRVLARAGAVPVNLPLGQIIPAFAAGKIDAADVVGPAIDATLPLKQYAPHYMAPWHEPDVAMHVFIDRAKFQALPTDLQEIVRQAAQAAALRSAARANDRNAVALRELEAAGIRVKPFPAPVLKALRDATQSELDVSAQADPDASRVIESWRAYKARVAPYSLQADMAVFSVR